MKIVADPQQMREASKNLHSIANTYAEFNVQLRNIAPWGLPPMSAAAPPLPSATCGCQTSE